MMAAVTFTWNGPGSLAVCMQVGNGSWFANNLIFTQGLVILSHLKCITESLIPWDNMYNVLHTDGWKCIQAKASNERGTSSVKILGITKHYQLLTQQLTKLLNFF